MSHTPDIEAIVRDVLSRLQPALGSAVAAPKGEGRAANKLAAATTGEAGRVGTGAGAVAHDQKIENQQPTSELRLAERVVTLDTLRGRLKGVSRLVVPKKALVTPAAGDELRERQVELVRCDRAAGGARAAKAMELLVATIGKYETTGLARQLGAGESQHYGELSAALTTLAGAVDGGSRALLLCARPASAVCQANRRGPLRAAWAIDVASAREAVETAGVNLLVLQPRRDSLMQMVNIGRAFAKARIGTH